MLLFLYVSIVIDCELLAPLNEAVLAVTPCVGKCCYIHFTEREMKHIGTKWLVAVHTQHIAEQGLEITFQITGLELLPEVLHSPFFYSAISSAPLPQPPAHHHSIMYSHLISFWAWEQLNHFNHLGLLRKLSLRRHMMHTAAPDIPACMTLTRWVPMESGLESKNRNSRKGCQERCHKCVLPLFLECSQS